MLRAVGARSALDQSADEPSHLPLVAPRALHELAGRAAVVTGEVREGPHLHHCEPRFVVRDRAVQDRPEAMDDVV